MLDLRGTETEEAPQLKLNPISLVMDSSVQHNRRLIGGKPSVVLIDQHCVRFLVTAGR